MKLCFKTQTRERNVKKFIIDVLSFANSDEMVQKGEVNWK